jgi:predicted secreted protein
MIQMPCPEMLCLGLNRSDDRGAQRPLLDENTRIRALMRQIDPVTLLHHKAEEIVTQIQEYQKYDFQVLGLIGVDRSPSCGIQTTSIDGAERPGQGVFIEILAETLARNGITLRMVGTKTSEKEKSLEKIRQFLDE